MKAFFASLAVFLSSMVLAYRVHFFDLCWADQVWATVATAVLFWAGVFCGMESGRRR